MFAVHVARFLSQKKQRKTIGAVHLVNELDGDHRKVSLILTPPVASDKSEKQAKKKKKEDGSAKKDKKSKVRFRVRLVFGVQHNGNNKNADTNTGWIPNARLFPDRCNNRVVPVPGKVATSERTPFYNNALAADMHHYSTTQILQNVSMTALKAFTESLTLLKIWCLQRGFLRGHDTFSETSLSMSLAYLYRRKMVTARMDSIQVFTVWMKFISDEDWIGEKVNKGKKRDEPEQNMIRHSSSLGYQTLDVQPIGGKRYRAGIVMPEESLSEKQTVLDCVQNRLYASDLQQKASTMGDDIDLPKHLLESFKMSTDAPIFLDPSMTVNYFGNLSPSFIREVQMDAKRALNCIHFHSENSEEAASQRIDPFRQLFFEHIRFWRRYDAYLSVNTKSLHFHASGDSKRKCSFWGVDSQDKGAYASLADGLVKVLRMGLGDRITSLRILTSGNSEINNDSSPLVQSEGLDTKILVESDGIQQIPIRHTSDSPFSGLSGKSIHSPISKLSSSGDESIVIGVCINSDTCHRLVDRGPPANEVEASRDFVALWGEKKAQLRRFKDGAIVHAAVWNEPDMRKSDKDFKFESGDRIGSIVESIIRHVLLEHFLDPKLEVTPEAKFKLHNILSLVEGATDDLSKGNQKLMNSSDAAHKSITAAFENLSKFLKSNSEVETNSIGEGSSKLGLPLYIDAVEALSPSLRYSATFPQIPHALLGSTAKGGKRVAGAIVGDPILIQIRFEGSSKWPSDINAMGAAKCALLTQIADGIDAMKNSGDSEVASFDGPMNVSPTHIDVGYSGYVWRIIIRADQEMKMLDQLRNPSADAVELRQALRKNHITRSLHHFTIHSVHSKQAASGYVTRLMQRWIAGHMLSGQVPQEAVELIVASVFTDASPLQPPATAMCGFMRCLNLIGTHEWARSPLIVDPEGHIDADAKANIHTQFEKIRGTNFQYGPPMFIISPNDRHGDDGIWRPSFTQHIPEKVVLGRLISLAKRSHQFLMNIASMKGSADSTTWTSVFQESPESLKAYSALFRVNPENIIDSSCSSTGSDFSTSWDSEKAKTPYYRTIEKLSLGPKALRIKAYKNLNSSEDILYSFQPIEECIEKLRSKFGKYACFFYNEYCPDMIAMLWRPVAFQRKPFSAMHAEFHTPIENNWEENGLVTANCNDILRAIKCTLSDVIVGTKVYDDKSIKLLPTENSAKSSTLTKKSKRKHQQDSSSSEEDSE